MRHRDSLLYRPSRYHLIPQIECRDSKTRKDFPIEAIYELNKAFPNWLYYRVLIFSCPAFGLNSEITKDTIP